MDATKLVWNCNLEQGCGDLVTVSICSCHLGYVCSLHHWADSLDCLWAVISPSQYKLAGHTPHTFGVWQSYVIVNSANG